MVALLCGNIKKVFTPFWLQFFKNKNESIHKQISSLTEDVKTSIFYQITKQKYYYKVGKKCKIIINHFTCNKGYFNEVYHKNIPAIL